jgi:hypothetical protein
VPDLDEAAAVLLVRHGLIALPRWRAPAVGDAQPHRHLGPCYLEIVAVADDAVAAQNPFGSWVAAMARRGVVGWRCARRHHGDGAAAGIDVVPESGSVPTARLSWPESPPRRRTASDPSSSSGTPHPMPGETRCHHPAR